MRFVCDRAFHANNAAIRLAHGRAAHVGPAVGLVDLGLVADGGNFLWRAERGDARERAAMDLSGDLQGIRINIAFMADNAGFIDMEGQVPAATDGKTAKGVFDDLTAATPVFSSAMPAIRQWILVWNGSSGVVSTDVPGAHVSIESDATWITLTLARVPPFGSPNE